MIVNNISPCITTKKIKESKDFYIKYFDAKIIFDCGWYIDLRFGKNNSGIQFMEPQQSEQKLFAGAGLTYNFMVDDVDKEYKRLTDAGLTAIMPLEDHPWGDRGFAILDPNDIALYIYSDREPAKEFKNFFNSE